MLKVAASGSTNWFAAEGALGFAGFLVFVGGFDDDFGAVDWLITNRTLGLHIGFATLCWIQWVDRVTGTSAQQDHQNGWCEFE